MKRLGYLVWAFFFVCTAHGMHVELRVRSSVPASPRSVLRAVSNSVPELRKRKRIEFTEPVARVCNDDAPVATSSVPHEVRGQRRLWRVPNIDQTLVKSIMREYNVGRHVASTLITRGYTAEQEITAQTAGLSEDGIPHASLLKDSSKAIDRIMHAIAHKEHIRICGDYDVDGMTSSAMMKDCITQLGGHVSVAIPHRVRDGYGIKGTTVDAAQRDGVSLLITVDNGTTAFEPARRAKELGIDLIITDHHRVSTQGGIPDAYAFVNPNQPECPYPNKGLAGVGVAFKLMNLLYERKGLPLPDRAFELMMLGTIADVVPLTPENKYWVRYGLAQVNASTSTPAFKKMCATAKLAKPRITATDIAFCVTPQLNAIGRLDDANEAVKFLLSDNQDEIEQIGDRLSTCNTERKKIQADMFNDVKQRIQAREVDLSQNRVIMLSSPEWHPGVNGLVASKTVERYYKPTILFQEIKTDDGEILLKGSGRSTAYFDLFSALEQCKDLLITFGGHVAAAGIVLKKSNLAAFKERMQQVSVQRMKRSDTIHRDTIDACVSFDELTADLVNDFAAIEPFGSGNPQPTLLFDDVHVAGTPTFMGRLHVRCLLQSNGTKRNVKFFFRPDMYYRLKELKENDASFKLIGHPDANFYNGQESIEVNAVDIERVVS